MRFARSLCRTIALAFAAAPAFLPGAPAAAFIPYALPRAVIGPLTWSRLPGVVSKAAVAPDGTLWALSTSPAGANKYTLHYVNGRWISVAGPGATSIAVGPTGTLYAASAANSPTRGVYAYNGASWTSLGGAGLDRVAAGADGSVYALGVVADGAGNRAVWKRNGTSGWVRQSTTGVLLAGSFAKNPYSVAGVGTVQPNGYFVLKASGAIYYYTATGAAYVRFPGAASDVAPVSGGFFALAFPGAASGARLSYFDYASATVTPEPNAFASLAAGPGRGGPWTQLYAIDSAGTLRTTSITFAVTPKLTEFAVKPGCFPKGIAAGSDGALWFTEYLCDKIGRITTAGKITEYSVFPSSLPDAITAGPDGNLWFVETVRNKIGRMTTAGVLSGEFTIPTFPSGTAGITVGPDGNLWFLEMIGNKAGRITTAGVVKEFPLKSAQTVLFGIASGSDGSLWFPAGYAGANKIDRMTVNGVVTEFPNPIPYYGARGIAAGPDGGLWFSEYGDFKIGRATTAGSISQYATPGLTPTWSLAAGPDGAIWFTAVSTTGGHEMIGRMTVAGNVTQYAIPRLNNNLQSITAGADGAMWFTEGQSSKIGRLSLH